MTQTLRTAGEPARMLEEVPAPRFSIGDGKPEPVAQGDDEPAPPEVVAPEATEPPVPVHVPWTTDPEDGDDAPPGPRPEHIERPRKVALSGHGPGDAGAHPCSCSSPCSVSARSLAALMANPAMTGADPLTTVAGRSALLAASRPFGPTAPTGGRFVGAGSVGTGRIVAITRVR